MLNSIKIKETIAEVQRFTDRAEAAISGDNHIDHDDHVYVLKRTSIDAENALKALRKSLLTLTPVSDPAPVLVPESPDGSEAVI